MTAYEEMSKRVEGKNINPRTLLATDYLNHFNEIIMLMEMIPDMPELLEEAKNWHPKTYVQHFQDSTFTNRELAVEAYELVPRKYRRAFEYAVGEINRIIIAALDSMEHMKDQPDQLLVFAKQTFDILRTLIEATSSVINGVDVVQTQSTVDTIIDG